MTTATPAFKRILLKLSGEALAANQGFGVETARIHEVAAELADVHKLGVQTGHRRGWRKFFSRRGAAGQGHGPRFRRSHGHAGHCDQCAGAAGCAGEAGRLHARAVGDRDEPGGGAFHPAARHSASGKGPRRDLCRRHRQSLLLDRYGGIAARDGDQGRRDSQGHESRWHLRRRSA